MGFVDSLLIKLGVDDKEFQSGLNRAQEAFKGTVSTLTKIAAPLVGALAVGKLFSDYTQEADALGKFAASIGETVENVDAWSQAIAHAGGTVESAKASIATLNKGIVEMAETGKGRAAIAFQALGISVKDASGKARNATDVMMDLAAKAEKMDAAEFRGWGQKLGLDDGTIQLLQTGKAATEDLVEAGKKMAYHDEDVKTAEAFNDTLQDLGKSMKSLSAIVMRMILPFITKMADLLRRMIMFLQEHEKVVRGFFVLFATLMGVKMVASALAAAKALANVSTAFKALNAVMALNPFVLAAAAIVALGVALQDVYVFLQGGESYFGDFLKWLGISDKAIAGMRGKWIRFKTSAKEAIDATLGKLKEFGQGLKASLGAKWKEIEPQARAFFLSIPGHLSRAWAKLKEFAAWLGPQLKDAFEAVKPVALGYFKAMGSALSTAWGLLKRFIGWLGPKLKQGFGEAKPHALALFNGIKKALGLAWDSLKAFAAWIGPKLGQAWERIKPIALVVLKAIGSALSFLWDRLKLFAAWVGPQLTAVWEIIAPVATAVFGKVKVAIDKVWAVLMDFADWLAPALSTAFEIIGPIAATVFDGICAVASVAWEILKAVAAWVADVFLAVWGPLSTIVGAAFDGAIGFIKGFWNFLKEVYGWIKDTFLKVFDKISAAKGFIDGLFGGDGKKAAEGAEAYDPNAGLGAPAKKPQSQGGGGSGSWQDTATQARKMAAGAVPTTATLAATAQTPTVVNNSGDTKNDNSTTVTSNNSVTVYTQPGADGNAIGQAVGDSIEQRMNGLVRNNERAYR